MNEPTYVATEIETWQRIHSNAIAIVFPKCRYNENELHMLREMVRELRVFAMNILDDIPRGAIPSPSPNTPAPKPI